MIKFSIKLVDAEAMYLMMKINCDILVINHLFSHFFFNFSIFLFPTLFRFKICTGGHTDTLQTFY